MCLTPSLCEKRRVSRLPRTHTLALTHMHIPCQIAAADMHVLFNGCTAQVRHSVVLKDWKAGWNFQSADQSPSTRFHKPCKTANYIQDIPFISSPQVHKYGHMPINTDVQWVELTELIHSDFNGSKMRRGLKTFCNFVTCRLLLEMEYSQFHYDPQAHHVGLIRDFPGLELVNSLLFQGGLRTGRRAACANCWQSNGEGK